MEEIGRRGAGYGGDPLALEVSRLGDAGGAAPDNAIEALGHGEDDPQVGMRHRVPQRLGLRIAGHVGMAEEDRRRQRAKALALRWGGSGRDLVLPQIWYPAVTNHGCARRRQLRRAQQGADLQHAGGAVDAQGLRLRRPGRLSNEERRCGHRRSRQDRSRADHRTPSVFLRWVTPKWSAISAPMKPLVDASGSRASMVEFQAR